MKNMKKSLLLTAALFSLVACGAAGGTANSIDSGYTSGSTAAPEGEFDITYVADDAVEFTGPTSAAKDAKVTFSITYSDEVYVVESIKVNNELPFSEGDNVFSFVMPEEAVTVTVTGHYVDPTHGKYRIENVNENCGVILDGASDYAKPGETVSFTVKFIYASPYTFTGNVYVLNGSSSEDVEVTSANGVYSFVMPEANAIVEAEVEANKYQITIDSSEKSANFASSPFAVETEEDVFTNLTGESFDKYYHGKDYYAYYAKYNDNIRVKVKKGSDKLIINGVRLSGAFSFTYEITELEPVPEEDYYYCYFTMPAHTVDVTAFGSVNYKSVAVENSTHFQATLKVKDGDEYVAISNLDQVIPGTVVYVDISWIGEPDTDYGFDKITVDQVTSISTDTAGERYHFTMPNKDGVKVTVFEKNYSQYKNYDFVGNHFGAEIEYTGSGRTLSMSSSYDGTILGDGTVNIRGTSYSGYSIDSIEDRGSFGLVNAVKDTKTIQFAYSGKFIIGHYYYTKDFAASFGTDFAMNIVAESGDTRSNYKYYYQMNSAKTFLAVQAFRVVDGVETLYAVLAYDIANGEIYSKDVTFNFTSGTKVSESTCAYTIDWNGTTIGTVTGGSNFTSLIPHPQELTIVNSTHFAATAYDGDTAIGDLTAINAGSEVTIKLADVDAGDGQTKGTDFEFGSLSFTDGSGATVSVTVTTVTAGEEYKFTMPKADITMTVKENNLKILEGHELVGSYVGANIYAYSGTKQSVASTSSSYNSTIAENGTFMKNTNKYIVSEVSTADGDGLATLSTGNQFLYGGNFLVADYGLDTTVAKMGSDLDVFVKKQSADDTATYKMKYLLVYGSFLAVQATRNDVLYASMFFDLANKEFYATGLVFEFAGAGQTVDTTKTFTVKVGTTTIGTVTNGTYAKA